MAGGNAGAGVRPEEQKEPPEWELERGLELAGGSGGGFAGGEMQRNGQSCGLFFLFF